MRKTKQDIIKEYNENNPGYNITAIKTLDKGAMNAYEQWGKSSLYDLYDKPSQAKIDSWNEIIKTYSPDEILAVVGNSYSYSVLLIAGNGDVLHITRSNNYLVEVK